MHDTDICEDPPPNKTEALSAASEVPDGAPRRLLPFWALMLGTGTLAGLASWAAGESMIQLFLPPLTEVRMRGTLMRIITWHDELVADAKNAVATFALLGGLLGAMLGAAGGLVRRNARAAAMAGLLGLVMGAATAGGMALILLPLYNAFQEHDPDEALKELYRPLLVHLGIWATAGAASGLAFAVGFASRGRTLGVVAGGFLGAALGTVIYDFIGAMAFPMAGTTKFISLTAGTRLLARVAVTVCAAAGVAIGLTMKIAPEGEPSPASAKRLA